MESTSHSAFKRLVQVALVLVLLTVGILFWPQDSLEVKVTRPEQATVESRVSAVGAGQVKPASQVMLRAPQPGKILKVLAARGQRVERGAVLIEMDGQTADARVRLARANLAAGQSALRSTRLHQEVTTKALNRNRGLFEQGLVARQVLERIETEHAVANEAVLAAEANVEQLRAQVDLARSILSDSLVVAPFGGLVASVNVREGDSLLAGAPVLELVDDSRVFIGAAVDEADVGRIRLDLPVRVECDSFPDHPFEGRLSWIAPLVARDARQNRQVDIEVDLVGEAGGQLKIGMSADIEIIVEHKDSALTLPTQTIMRRTGSNFVYVVDGDRARLQRIETGLSNWDKTEILSGLNQGSLVITSLDNKELTDGIRVRLPGVRGAAPEAF